MRSQAAVPQWIHSKGDDVVLNIISVIAGSLLVAMLAQIAIPLPWTPVPVTGQTFGVALLALLWGRHRASAAFLVYLIEGAAGLPVFAAGTSGIIPGPTLGYLFGMLLATFVVGALADRGFAKTLRGAFLCCVAGSSLILTCGVIGLSFFLPKESLLAAGVLPFLPGDVVKNLAAALIVTRLQKKRTE